MSSITQTEAEVKCDEPTDECEVEICHEPVFRAGLCFDHFVEEETVRWDDQDAEREICLAGVGILSGDPDDYYKRREAAALWQELAVAYPDLAGRETDPEKIKELAEKAVTELFGPEDKGG